MLRFSISTVLVVLLWVHAYPQTFEKYPAGKGLYGYYLYLPKAYQTNATELFPLLIAFHGVGEGGSGSESDLNKLTSTGIPKIIASGSWPDDRPFIVLCPQSTQGFYNPDIIKSTINHITKTYRVDVNRIYMTGFSAGAISIWNDLNDHYKYIAAAVIPVSGARNRNYDVCEIKDVPIWAFHGEDDPNGPTPAGGTIKNVDAINDCTPAPNPKAKATIYPGVGHNAWDITYNLKGMSHSTKYDPYDMDIYSWLLQYSLDKSEFGIASFYASPTSIPAGQTTKIRFTASIMGEASSVTVNLTTLGGNSSHTLSKNGGQYILDYTAPANLATGSKTVILTATDKDGKSLTKSLNIIVEQNKTIAPPENLKAIPKGTSKIELEWIDKSDNENGFVIEYKEAGQAFFNALQTVSENATGYLASDLKCNVSYEFRVKAVNDASESAYSNAASASTLSLEPPVISPAGETAFCEGGSVTISTASNYSEYLWNNNAKTKSIDATETGTYRLKVKNAEGCWSDYSNSVKVTVHAIPEKPVIHNENTSALCPGVAVTLAAPDGYDQYLWSTGETTQSIEVKKDGKYTVSVANNQCWSPVSNAATVAYKNKPGKPAIEYTGATELCVGESAEIKAPDGFQYYQWSNGATANSLTVKQSGTFTVQVAHCPNEWSQPSEPIQFSFNPVPSKPTIDFDQRTYCIGETAILSVNGEFEEYAWSNRSTQPKIEVKAAGKFSVKVKNKFNCWSKSSNQVEVVFKDPGAKPVIESDAEVNLCKGETITLKTTGEFDRYLWSNGATTPSIKIDQPGIYSVKTSNCSELWSESSEAVTVTIHAPSSPVIFTNGDTLYTNEYEGYQWMENDKIIEGAVYRYYLPERENYYTVEIIDKNGCTAISNPKKFAPKKLVYRVFPNPTTGRFFVKLNSDDPFRTAVSIQNLQGQTLYFKEGFDRSHNFGNPLEIDISALSKGLYMLFIFDGKEMIREKLVLE